MPEMPTMGVDGMHKDIVRGGGRCNLASLSVIPGDYMSDTPFVVPAPEYPDIVRGV